MAELGGVSLIAWLGAALFELAASVVFGNTESVDGAMGTLLVGVGSVCGADVIGIGGTASVAVGVDSVGNRSDFLDLGFCSKLGASGFSLSC